jgi:hypothetical protein
VDAIGKQVRYNPRNDHGKGRCDDHVVKLDGLYYEDTTIDSV